jgi:hypothetical protein
MNKLYKSSFASSFGVLVYVVIVASVMSNADKMFGKEDNFLTPVIVLLLFTLSALIVGGLVLGKPIMLYLDGKKKEAVSLLCLTAGWLAVFTVIAFVFSALI